MAGKTYNAGTIFLQVVPVFGDTMNAIKRQAKDLDKALTEEADKAAKTAGKKAGETLGLEMGKAAKEGGKKAAKDYLGEFQETLRSGIEKTSKELKPIKIRVERNELRKDFAEIKKELADLEKAKIGVDLDAATALARLKAVQAALASLKDSAKNIEVRTNLDEAQKGVNAFVKRIETANPEIRVDVDTKAAERQMGAFEKRLKRTLTSAAAALGDSLDGEIARVKRRLDRLNGVEIGVHMTADEALKELDELDRALLDLQMRGDVGVDVDVNATAARAELAALRRAINETDRDDINVRADADVASAVAKLGLLGAVLGSTAANMRGTGSATENAANSFRSFNWRVLAAAALIPPLIPMIGALGGALIALAPAAVAAGGALGTMLLGFSGIGEAVTALSDANKNAAKDTQATAKKMRSAAEGVADAQRSLARAREDAAERNADAARNTARAEESASRQIRDALERQRDAERNLADAQRDARQAQQDLTEARREARAEMEQLGDRAKQNALDERQAVIDLFNAQVEYNAAMEDGAATNLDREQASINLEQARLSLKEIRDEEKEIAKERKKGVAGSDLVQSAQERVAAALERQRDAQRAVGDAAAAVNQARIDGAEMVADAVRAQQRAEEDGIESISDAQRGLRRAQQDYRDALVETQVIGTESMQKLEEAMGKLSPAGRRFARFLFSLRDEFYALRAAAQEGMLPGVQEGIETLVGHYGPRLQRFIGLMATTLGDMFVRMAEMLTSPAWDRFFSTMAEIAPLLVETFGAAFGNFATFLAELLVIAAPFAVQLAEGLKEMTAAWLEWIQSDDGKNTMRSFLEYAFEVGPKVMKFIGALGKGLIAIAVALAPWGEAMMTLLTGLFNFIADLDPKILGAILSAALGMAIAFQLAVGAVAILLGGLAVFAFPISKFIFLIGLAITAIVILYTQSETFRDIVNGVFEAIGEVLTWVWEGIILPIFEGIRDGFTTLAKDVQGAYDDELEPVFTALGGIVRWVWDKVLRPVFGFIGRHWDTLAKGIRWTWRNILWPVIDLLGTAILKGLWYGIIKPTFNLIRGAFEILGAGMKLVWKNVIAPVLNALGFAVSDDLVQAFKDAMGGIRKLWNGLVEIIGRPLRFVIQTILNNGLIAGFNKIAKFVGSDTMSKIPVPKWSLASMGNTGAQPNLNPGRSGVFAATGAVLPGWTPGRDVHHFVSPTGGQLHLSGGEAVMRPEWTKAMGPGYVHYMNRIARMEGVDGIRKRLSGQAYARGGITPAPGSWNRHTSGYPWATWAGDINVPGDSDYGNPVRAYKAGVVAAVQALTGSYGKHIRVNHPDGSQTLYAHLSSMFVRPGQKIDAGQMLGRVGSTGNSSGPHLHFEIKNGHFPVGMEDGSGSGMPGWLEKIIGTPVKWFGSLVEKGIDKAVDLFGGSPLLDLAAGVGKKLVGGLVDKVLSFFAGGNSDPDSLGIEGDIPNNAVRQTVQAMAKQYGWGRGDQWEALAEIISRESSWDPNAANPSSSARGLFQKMTSLHGALEGTVEGQTRWGLDYIRRAYGNPMNALMHHNKHGWYADGGIVGDQAASTGLADNGTMMYDSGGYLPPGLTTVVNLTGKPEPVFTAEQFEAMENGGGGGLTYAPTFNGSDLTAADVADDLEFSFRKLRREGKYAKAGT